MREKSSLRPILDYPLGAFTGDRSLIEALLIQDIETNGDLLAAASSEIEIRQLADEIGVETVTLDSLVRICDIARVPGIGKSRAGFLVNELGVRSMQALRDQDAEALLESLRSREPRLKSDVVSDWIASAHSMELRVDPESLPEDVRISRRLALRRMMTLLGIALVVLLVALVISYVIDRISISAMAMSPEVPQTVWTQILGMLNLAALLRATQVSVLAVLLIGFLALALLGYARLANRGLHKLEEQGGPEYRVFVRHLEKANALYSKKSMLVSTSVVLALAAAVEGIALAVPGGAQLLSSILQEAIHSMRAGEAAVPLTCALLVMAPPLLLAMRKRQKVLHSYPGITPEILRRANQSHAAELGIGLTMIILWAVLGIGIAVGSSEAFSERIGIPALDRAAAEIREAAEAAVLQNDIRPEDFMTFESQLGDQARGYLREDMSVMRDVLLFTQGLLLLILTAAIYILALTTIITFAKVSTKNRKTRLLMAGGIVLTTILIPFALDYALRASPTLSHLTPYLAFGALLLGVLFGFAW